MKSGIKKRAIFMAAFLLLAGICVPAAYAATAKTADTSAYIGVEAAKEIALDHAGVTSDAATFTKEKLDYDDGIAEYEIKFYTDGTKYEYELDALSGTITDYEAKMKKQTATAQMSDTTGYIGIDEAKQIALDHAGVTSDAATFTKKKLDYDDGVAEYEIEFYVDGTEYEYEIDALSGTIMDWEIEAHKQR